MFNFVKQVFLLLPAEGSLVDIRAYIALCLGGTPSQETGTSSPSCLLLDNRLFIFNTTQISNPNLQIIQNLYLLYSLVMSTPLDSSPTPHSGQKEKRLRNAHMCVTTIHFPLF